jgi:hypothetical protein
MFKIDFFELLILAEVCIPPVPIARAVFFDNLSDIHYNMMNDYNREYMFDVITKNSRFDIANSDCRHFFNRFNPNNQFGVCTKYEEKEKTLQAYLHNGKYHISKNKWIESKYIVSVNKINQND